jgi:TolB protein
VIALPVVAVYVLAPIATEAHTEAQRAKEAFPTENGEIIFTSEGPPYPGTVISTINSDGTALATIPIRPGHDNTFPAWSPDGKKIAFVSSMGKAGSSFSPQLYIVDVDGSGLRRITDTPRTYESDPAWSPDGKRIAFSKGKGDIYTIKIDGTGLRQLTSDKGGEREPTWSPDGKKIAFVIYDDIYTMNATDGSQQENLTHHNFAGASSPDWSPDGEEIAFSSGAGDIFVMKADGTKVEQLTKTQGWEHSPDWRQLP